MPNKNPVLLDEIRREKQAEAYQMPKSIPTQAAFFALGYAASQGRKVWEEEDGRFLEPPEWADVFIEGFKQYDSERKVKLIDSDNGNGEPDS